MHEHGRKKEYIQSIYNTIVISLRDKSMPKSIPEYCKPWIFDDIKSDDSVKYKRKSTYSH